MHFRRVALIRLATLVLLLAVVLGSAGSVSSATTLTRRQRFGIGFTTQVWEGDHRVAQSLSSYNLDSLQVGWYSDWQYRAMPSQPKDVTPATRLEYVQLLEVRDDVWPPDWSAVQNAVTLNPQSTWIIGNEPECPNQGNLTPAEYATRYHEAYVRIKGWDPSAQVAIGGVVEPTPLRLRWLEAMMSSYATQYGHSMTTDIDVWTIHMQILTEGPGTAGAGEPVGITVGAGEAMEFSYPDCARVEVFKSLVTDFRTWLAAQGEREKPLIISEMGVLMPSYLLYEDSSMTEAQRAAVGDRLIEQFMSQVFDWLLTAKSSTIGCTTDGTLLVQRWLWFSLNDSFYDEETNPKGFNGALFDYQSKTLTRFGQRFVAYQSQTNRLSVPLVQR